MYLCNLLLVAVYVFTINIHLAVDEDIFIILLQCCVTGTEVIVEVGVTNLLLFAGYSFCCEKDIRIAKMSIRFSLSIYLRCHCHYSNSHHFRQTSPLLNSILRAVRFPNYFTKPIITDDNLTANL